MRTSLYDYCVERSELALLTQWHPTKNLPLTPEQVLPGSEKKVWWRCGQGHEWQAEIRSRVSGCGCPVCKNDLSGCKGKEKPTETEKPAEPEKPKKETGSVGTILFILAALLAVGGIGYYVKIVRPKQQAEDDAEFEDDGYGEGFDPDEAYGEPEYLSEDDFDDKDSK